MANIRMQIYIIDSHQQCSEMVTHGARPLQCWADSVK